METTISGVLLIFFQISMAPWPVACIFSVKPKKPDFLLFTMFSSHPIGIFQWLMEILNKGMLLPF